jgi:hypothetical protein
MDQVREGVTYSGIKILFDDANQLKSIQYDSAESLDYFYCKLIQIATNSDLVLRNELASRTMVNYGMMSYKLDNGWFARDFPIGNISDWRWIGTHKRRKYKKVVVKKTESYQYNFVKLMCTLVNQIKAGMKYEGVEVVFQKKNLYKLCYDSQEALDNMYSDLVHIASNGRSLGVKKQAANRTMVHYGMKALKLKDGKTERYFPSGNILDWKWSHQKIQYRKKNYV